LAVVIAGDVAKRKRLDVVVRQPRILCLLITLVITCAGFAAGEFVGSVQVGRYMHKPTATKH
jgi:hypothetical protein